MLDQKALEAARAAVNTSPDTIGTWTDAMCVKFTEAYLSAIVPADVAGLVDEWRKAAEGVTPGPWKVYDGCSWRRIGTAHGRHDDCAVIAPTKALDGHPDLTCSRGNDREANLEWLARCSPDKIGALLTALASISADLATVKAERNEWRMWAEQHHSDLRAAESSLASERAAHARTREALEPFARYASENGFGLDHNSQPLPGDGGVGWIYLTYGDFRAARRAYQEGSDNG